MRDGSNLELRRKGDSNPRSHDCRTTVFETAAFDHSAISPEFLSAIRFWSVAPGLSHKCDGIGMTKIIHISFDNSFL